MVKKHKVKRKPAHVAKKVKKINRKNETYTITPKQILNIWRSLAIIAIIALVVSMFFPKTPVSVTSESDVLEITVAAQKAIDYINNNLLEPGTVAEMVGSSEIGDLYSIEVKIGQQVFSSYITRDGGLLFATGFNLSAPVEAPAVNNEEPAQAQPPATDAPKSDKPVVEAFIMSHCPYGTQIEKGILPVANLLGDKIDFEIKFVYYAMHGEIEVVEQLNQYCIQEEQNDKFLAYLACFLEEGDGESCLAETAIDMDALSACTASADEEFNILSNLEDQSLWLNGRYPLFNIHKSENEEYGVGGSPTLIINGAKVNSGRDSVSLLSSICNSFNEAPEECDTELDSVSPGPGFGWSTTGAANNANCGG